ncbi:hypothetical protein HRbin15_01481 [bacterium HR15]|nr:hypothetical protein HRbin15_01481 [bacterium HR15]
MRTLPTPRCPPQVLREKYPCLPHAHAVPKGTRRFGGRWLGGDALRGEPVQQLGQAFIRKRMEAGDEDASGRQRVVGQAFGGKREKQASGGGVFAHAEQEQGEHKRFGVFGGSSAFWWEGVLLAEALDEGVDAFHRQGGEGGVVRVATLHRVFYTRCPRFFEQPLTP